MERVLQVLRHLQLIRHFHGAQSPVHFMQQLIALPARSPAIDFGHDVVLGAGQVRVPVDVPLFRH